MGPTWIYVRTLHISWTELGKSWYRWSSHVATCLVKIGQMSVIFYLGAFMNVCPHFPYFLAPIWVKLHTDSLHILLPKSCASRENWPNECHILLWGVCSCIYARTSLFFFGNYMGETSYRRSTHISTEELCVSWKSVQLNPYLTYREEHFHL